MLKMHEEQAGLWKEHFGSILNCPELMIMHRFEGNAKSKLEIEEEPITPDEIKAPIKGFKQGDATGFDRIQAEILKAEGEVLIE
ncbi:unnamed protein product [Caretta caretta]